MVARTSKQRLAAHKDRIARGRIVVPIEIDAANVAALLTDADLLHPWSEDDRTKLSRGIERLLEMLTIERSSL